MSGEKEDKIRLLTVVDLVEETLPKSRCWKNSTYVANFDYVKT